MASISMQVIKRNGAREDVSFDKVLNRIQTAAAGLEVNPTLIAQRTLLRIHDGVKTSELDELAAQLSISLMTTHTDYGTLAARLAITNHHQNTSDRFTDVVEALANQVMEKTGERTSTVSQELIDLCRLHGDAINQKICHERDHLFDYFGFKTLEKLQYLLRDTKGKTLERPQYLLMRVSLALWGSVSLEKAFETYDLLSQKYFIHATPTNFNAGTPRQQLSSCFLLEIKGDAINLIYDTLKDCALISKYAGGIGLHIHNIRAKGSLIRGTNGTSNGIVPMLRNFNDTARYVDQCFTPDTLVTTDQGPRPISEIKAGDRVLTHKGTYETVQKQVIHQYKGQMFAITLEGHDTPVRVTEEHPILSLLAKGDSLKTVLARVQMGVDAPDYLEVKELVVGDVTVFPKGLKSHGIIASIVPVEYDGPVYDFEVEGEHNYTVTHLGVAHNGGGKRNGSFAIYLEPWHADVEDFLKLKLNTGSEEERCRDLFYALWISDLFMERVEANVPWTLFCPSEAPGLADVYGDEFRALYERYEAEGRGRKQIDAQKLWFKILDAQIETGTPYLLFKDAANQKSNQKNVGTIKSSNLCVAPETYLLTDQGQQQISTLVGQTVRVWNGEDWSETVVHKTGENQRLVTVFLSNGAQLTCTPYHKFLIRSGVEDHAPLAHMTRVDASELKEGMMLPHSHPTTDPLLTVASIVDTGRVDDTYCVNEPHNHAAVFNGILTGNCTEIMEYSAPDESAVCNLASLALPAYVNATTKTFDYAMLRSVVKVAIRNLNRVIDINYYPTPETERSNFRHRPVGLGVQGLADVFALLRVSWESEKAADLNQRIFEHIYYAAVESSCEIAAEDGPYSTFEGSPMSQGIFQYDMWGVTPLTSQGAAEDRLDWEGLKEKVMAKGVRNSLLVAPMPTASTSQILGFNECIEPFTSNLYARRTLAGEFVVINKHLMKDLQKLDLWNEMMKQQIITRNGSIQGLDQIPESIQRLYKTSWEIKQKTLIDMAAARGAFICQSQSMNLFVGDPNYAKLTSMHFYSWKKGLKTGIYYLRTRAPVMAQKFTVDPELQREAQRSEQMRLLRKSEADSECVMCGS